MIILLDKRDIKVLKCTHWIALQPVQEPTKNPIPQMNILKQTMLKNYKNLGMVVKKLQKKRFTLACLGTMLEQIIHYFKFKLSNTYRCIAYITLQIRID